MYISDYLLWVCMIIQIVVFLMLIRVIVDFLNRFKTQVGIIELIKSTEEDKKEL
ncbi:hypothetical protein [Bacillus wiedmannii]|uniref:hypothetical protein n=1 Tax=Bacillus wiedmannii TaxID=1890302 RepID=UPI00159BC230|nr:MULTISPECIES: hypothetical protein [Bacillus]MDJ1477684.1 hypothetical protein [Bacillus sp. LS15-K4]